MTKFANKWKDLEELNEEFEVYATEKTSMKPQYDEFLKKYRVMETNRKTLNKNIAEAAMIIKKDDNLLDSLHRHMLIESDTA